jgi:hypothetical protein
VYTTDPWQQQLARTSANALLLGGEGTQQTASALESQRLSVSPSVHHNSPHSVSALPLLGTSPRTFINVAVSMQWVDGVGWATFAAHMRGQQ